MKTKMHVRPRLIGWAVLAVLLAALSVACQGKKGGASPAALAVDEVTLGTVESVLGTANDFASGVIDVTQGNGELIIAYRYYDADLGNYEADFASEMAPRIQALYKKFKSLDRVHFEVTANGATTPELWQPFAEFVVDRKTIEEIHWTGFLVKYLQDLVIKTKKGS
jgi:hypothetical protein